MVRTSDRRDPRPRQTSIEAAPAAGRRGQRRGGKDNITVVALPVEEEVATGRLGEDATLIGATAEQAGLTGRGRARPPAPRAIGAPAERRSVPSKARAAASPPLAAAPREGLLAALLSGRSLAGAVFGARRSTSSAPTRVGAWPSTAGCPTTFLWVSSSTRALLDPGQARVAPGRTPARRDRSQAALPRRRGRLVDDLEERRGRATAADDAAPSRAAATAAATASKIRATAGKPGPAQLSARNRELLGAASGRAAGHRGLHSRAHRPVERDRRPQPDLRRLLPRRLPGRPTP